jgi:hypothetical protein
MHLQYSGFDLFSNFAVYLMWSTGEILIGVKCLVPGQPVIEGGTRHIVLLTDGNNRCPLIFQGQQVSYFLRLVQVFQFG